MVISAQGTEYTSSRDRFKKQKCQVRVVMDFSDSHETAVSAVKDQLKL